jgi:membrane-associated phospholipid phosphatase
MSLVSQAPRVLSVTRNAAVPLHNTVFPAAALISVILLVAALIGSAWIGLRPDVLLWVPVCFGIALILASASRRLFPSATWLLAAIEGAFLICSLGLSLASLSYVGAAFRLPLQDMEIASLDHWLGFDWVNAAQAIDRSPALLTLLDAAYSTFTAQLVLTMVVLLLAGRRRDIDRYLVTFICASLFAEAASMLLPTLGPIATMAPDASFARVPTIGRTTADIVLALRSGTLRIIDLQALDGIISFPSLHAAVAILVPYHLRWCRPLFWPVLVLNVLMFISAIPSGNHYLADVLGGIVVAAFGIACGGRVHSWFCPSAGLSLAAPCKPGITRLSLGKNKSGRTTCVLRRGYRVRLWGWPWLRRRGPNTSKLE